MTTSQILRMPILNKTPWVEIIGKYLGTVEKGDNIFIALDIDGKYYKIAFSKKKNEDRIIRKAQNRRCYE